jgi:hypothetical protein
LRLTAAGQRLLLATYDNSRALRVYSVDFVWVRPNKQEQDQKPQLNPSLEALPMTALYSVAPSAQNAEAGQLQPTPYALTRLEFIPVIPDPSKTELNHPSIIAVFSVVANSPLFMHSSSQYHGPSVVCKWGLKKGPEFKPLRIIQDMAERVKVQLPSRVSPQPCSGLADKTRMTGC